MIIMELGDVAVIPRKIMKRNWKNYNSDVLLGGLSGCVFDYSITDVQQFWNNLENQIINVVDIVAPMSEFVNDYTTETSPQTVLKPLINKKHRLLRLYKTSKQIRLLTSIKEINKVIIDKGKLFKSNSIRRSLVPGNSKSFWNAINVAKDINRNEIPNNMMCDGLQIDSDNLSDAFAQFFDSKVKSINETCRVNDNVYNGSQKVNGLESNFMTTRNVREALKSIKIKNC